MSVRLRCNCLAISIQSSCYFVVSARCFLWNRIPSSHIYDFINQVTFLVNDWLLGSWFILNEAITIELSRKIVSAKSVLNVKFEGTAETYSELLDYHLHGYYSAFLSRESHPSNTAVSESINQENALSTLFPSIFISISMLMLLTTMKQLLLT